MLPQPDAESSPVLDPLDEAAFSSRQMGWSDVFSGVVSTLHRSIRNIIISLLVVPGTRYSFLTLNRITHVPQTCGPLA